MPPCEQKYTFWDGSTWSSEIVDPAVAKCNVVHSGIAVDTDGTPHMAWQVHKCASPGAQRYGVLTPDGWNVTTIDAGFSDYSASCSLVLDRTGSPHVIYGTKGQLVGGEAQLRHAYLDPKGEWAIEVIDNGGDAGERNAVAIDAQGYLHVAYYAGYGGQEGEIRYARSVQPVGGLIGDLNCDGKRDAFDIDPFVLALTDPAAYALKYPACDYLLADINGDRKVDTFDIDPFVELLTGG